MQVCSCFVTFNVSLRVITLKKVILKKLSFSWLNDDEFIPTESMFI